MCFRRGRLILAAVLLLGACNRQQDRTVRNVALPPFENLSSPELDWMSRGFSELLRLQLVGTARTRPLAIAALRDVPGSGATRIVHGYFSVAAGRLRVHAEIEETATHRMETVIALDGAVADGIVPLSREIARRIDPAAREVPTKSTAALRAYVGALTAGSPEAASHSFEQAVTADPAFGAAYLEWAQALAASGDRARAAQVAGAARTQAGRFPELERVRLGVMAAGLAGDRAAERTALIALARTDSSDAGVLRRLADLDTATHRYDSAAQWYEQVLARRPDDVASLNLLGYTYAWGGKLERAAKVLERYRALRPNEANPLDSLGDVNYYSGRFAEAAAFYEQAHAKDAALLAGGDLYKAAWARLMQGDRKAADETFSRFLAVRERAHDVVPYRLAQWEYVTGRPRQAIARLEQLAHSAPPPVASLAWAQLGFWSLEAGDRARALECARKAPASGALPALCALLAQPPATAEEWAARAERALPQPAQAPLRQIAVAYALLLSKNFSAAVAPLERAWNTAPPTSPDWPGVSLAWALVESGRFERVPELITPTPVPEPTGERPFLSLTFPRLFYLRGALAEKQNRLEDARANYKRFLELASDLPDYFGERARAAKVLAR
ncbi:MAG TPA: tetratricopeptide repeat protein [Bryobacteraceae bacterium]|nr:tetratricopeptide repeat protein [Bryobacteraceae bacterium]